MISSEEKEKAQVCHQKKILVFESLIQSHTIWGPERLVTGNSLPNNVSTVWQLRVTQGHFFYWT